MSLEFLKNFLLLFNNSEKATTKSMNIYFSIYIKIGFFNELYSALLIMVILLINHYINDISSIISTNILLIK